MFLLYIIKRRVIACLPPFLTPQVLAAVSSCRRLDNLQEHLEGNVFKKDLQRKLMIFKGFHGGSDREENLEVVHSLLLLWFYSIELNLICSKQPKL